MGSDQSFMDFMFILGVGLVIHDTLFLHSEVALQNKLMTR